MTDPILITSALPYANGPIHIGHLVTAEEAVYAFSLREVVFVPAGSPWQKERSDVADQRRTLTLPRPRRALQPVPATAAAGIAGVSPRE